MITFIFIQYVAYTYTDSSNVRLNSKSNILNPKFFKWENITQNLISDMYKPQVSVSLYYSEGYKYKYSEGATPHLDINMGQEFPIISFGNNFSRDTDGDMAGDWIFAYWMSINFNVFWDFLGDNSPIVNTDYRFHLFRLKFAYILENDLKVYAFLGGGHESTHLGDEFVINARKKYGNEFNRINVSWEYLDSYIGIGDKNNKWDIQVGFFIPYYLTSDDSFYSIDPIESPNGDILSTISDVESCFIGGQYTFLKIWDNWDLFISTDLRRRTQFTYSEINEKKVNCINLNSGFLYRHESTRLPVMGISFRYYNGINPHGQFRDEPDFIHFGLNIFLLMGAI